MSHPQPPQRQPTAVETEKYARFVHNAAIATLVACPILALLPPRKLDIYTLGLVATTGYSANYLLRESSGRSIWQHMTRQPAPTTTRQNAVLASAVGELQKDARSEQEQGYTHGWKAQRQQEIKEDVEEGKGFGDMIVDQVWEVWNQGKVKEEDDED